MTDHPEARLSHYVAALIERIVIEPHWATAVDTGTFMHGASRQQRFAREENRKKMGIKPHHLDWYIYGCQSRVYAQFELKVPTGVTSDGQKITMWMLAERGIPNVTCYSLYGVYEFLIQSGFRLHGNAENIVIELSNRWAAANYAAQLKKPLKAPRKPRAAGPTPRQAKKMIAIRASGVRL